MMRKTGRYRRELWRSDGTAGGTERAMDVLAGPAGSDPAELTVVGGALIFVADDGVHGRELENLSLARPVD